MSSNDTLFEKGKYILVQKDWKEYYIFEWDAGMQFIKSISNALILKGEPDLDEEGRVELRPATGQSIVIRPLSEEHLNALRMKSLVTKED